MIVGVPAEIKRHEYRVGLTPEVVASLTKQGHSVLIQTGAGSGSGYSDEDYTSAGAQLSYSAEAVFAKAELIVKVKELQSPELALIREDQIIFTFLHLAANPAVLDGLIGKKAVAISYDTVTDMQGGLPILKPMSQIAGRLASQEGIHYLARPQGSRGILLGGIDGVSAAKVVIIGGGTVGNNAAVLVTALGGELTIFDHNPGWVEQLSLRYGDTARCRVATPEAIAAAVIEADIVIGAALSPGDKTPVLVDAETIRKMKPGSVLVDVAIDQGGCFASSRPTTLDEPVYVEDGVIHYCVANMPSAVARTSTQALCHATAPYVLQLANLGLKNALIASPGLMNGFSACRGQVTNGVVARALGREFVRPQDVLGC